MLRDGELARAALLLERDGKDPGGSAAADMGPWIEDAGREGPEEALSGAWSFNRRKSSAVS